MRKLTVKIYPTLGHTLEEIGPISETFQRHNEAVERMIVLAQANPGAPVIGAIDNRTVVHMTYEDGDHQAEERSPWGASPGAQSMIDQSQTAPISD